ncbi:MAG: aldo/keto reductase [Armatimonadetes bacterium]|nr:aldo/keto reductase [Armatimonadota bacterium]
MKYRRLGATGLKVSEIALGNWLTMGAKLDEKASHQVLDRAWDLGVNLYDTADAYAHGEAEKILGAWLKTKPREQVVVATKGRVQMWDGPNGQGLSKKHLIEAANHSLKRLDLDYVDIYQFHWPDAETPIEESLEAMDLLMRQGKVLYAGCSNYDTELLRDALLASERKGLPRIVSIQPRYSMFDTHIETTLMKRCGAEGIGMIVYSPLEQGLLTEKYLGGKAPVGSRLDDKAQESLLTSENISALSALADIAHSRNAKLNQLALAWILTHPEITAPIVGATSPAQIEENAAASDVVLTPEELQQIEEVLQKRQKAVALRQAG